MTDGKINIEININDENVKRSLNDLINTIEKSMDVISNQLANAVNNMGSQLDNLDSNFDMSIDKIIELSKELEKTDDAVGLIGSSIKEAFGNSGATIFETTKEVGTLIGTFKNFTEVGDIFSKLTKPVTDFSGLVLGLTPTLGGMVGVIGAVTGAILLLTALSSDYRSEAEKLADSYEALDERLSNTSVELLGTKTVFNDLADSTLPKLKDSYIDFHKALTENKLSIGIEGLDNLEEITSSAYGTAKDTILENTGLIYDGMSTFYADSEALTAESEQNILNNVLEVGNQKLVAAQTANDSINSIYATARAEERALNEQELEEIKTHFDTLQEITMSSLYEGREQELMIQEQYKSKKGELSESEIEDYLTFREEMFNTDLGKTQEFYGTQLAAFAAAKDQGMISEEEYRLAKEEITANMNEKELELMEQQLQDVAETLTGGDIKKIEQYKKYEKEYVDLYSKAYDTYGNVKDKEAEKSLETVKNQMDDLGLSRKNIDEFEDFLDDQPEEYKAIYDRINKGMSMKNGIEELKKEVPASRKVGENITNSLGYGSNDGLKFAVDSLINVGRSMISGLKSDLQIASPSKVLRKLMKWVPIGGAKGIEDGSSDLISAADKMVDGVIKSTASLNDNSLFNMNSNVIPMLPLGSVVNIPEVKIPFEDKLGILNSNEELRNSIEEFIVSQQNDSTQKIDLYIDGTKLFNWVRKKKREYEFVTGGDF